MRAEFDAQAFQSRPGSDLGGVGDANRYVDAQAPWALRKTDPARMDTVLYVLVEVIRHIAILVQPVMPGSAAAILDQIAVPSSARQFSDLAQPIAPGLQLPSPRPVFPRYVDPETPETGAPK